jgi:hypothetical protein
MSLVYRSLDHGELTGDSHAVNRSNRALGGLGQVLISTRYLRAWHFPRLVPTQVFGFIS